MIHPDIPRRRFADACWWLLQALDEAEILDALVNSARELSGADCVYFAGREGDELRVMASSGLHNPDMARAWRVPVGEGISGRVVAEGAPAVLADYANDARRIRQVHSIVDAEGIRSAVALPVRRRTEVIGALCVTHRTLVEADRWPVEALELLVRQAVSQLDVAAAVEAERLAREVAETTTATIRRVEDLIGSLARVLGTEKRLHPGLELMAEFLGGSVLLVGFDGTVLERSGPTGPAPIQAEIDVDDDSTVLAQLRVFRRRPLEPLERRALDQCTAVIALDLLRERSALETERRLGRQLLSELLHSEVTDLDSLRYRASLLRIDLSATRAVVNLGVHVGRGRRREPSQLHDADLWVIEGCARGVAQNPVGWVSGSDVVLVFEIGDLTERDVRQLTSRFLRDAAAKLDKPLTAGIGRPCAAIADYPVAAREAQMAVELGRARLSPLEVVVRDELGLCALLGPAVDTRELITMTRRVLAPLLTADETSGSDYIHTLSVYHGCDRRLAESAGILHVHVNTLRYRLRKIEELLDVDLGDPSVRFMLELVLRAHETLRPNGGAKN